jgi:hypothetical protein
MMNNYEPCETSTCFGRAARAPCPKCHKRLCDPCMLNHPCDLKFEPFKDKIFTEKEGER